MRPLQQALGDAGQRVWLHSHQLHGDAPWPMYQRAIEEAGAYAVVVSPSGLQSSWVGEELEHAIEVQKQRGKDAYPIIVLSVDGTELGMLEQHLGYEPRYIPFSGGPAGAKTAIDAIFVALRMRQPADIPVSPRPELGSTGLRDIQPTEDLTLTLPVPIPNARAGGANSARSTVRHPRLPLQRMPAREVPDRFQVALSFSGAEREFVRTIAEAVERRLGSASVFFDEWYEFYVSGHDADVKLQRIYGTGCELAVVCVSATYGSKAWTRAEHEAIRSRLMQARDEQDPRQRDRILPIRVGDGNVDGIPFNAIVPDVRERTPEQVAELIADRLQFVMGSSARERGVAAADAREVPTSQSPSTTRRVPPPTPAYLNPDVQRLSEELERAHTRKQALREAGLATDEVDREILDLRRKLREGGQLRAGDSLGDGRYLLVKPIGRGGFAIVWEAHDRTEQRRVAIKVLHQHLAGDPQRRERFFRGARVMMELQHPAVVRVFARRQLHLAIDVSDMPPRLGR